MPASPQEREALSSPEQENRRQLSEHDPEAVGKRPPMLLIVVAVLVVTAFVVLHLTGVLGPGSH